jgi:mRNA interferase HigB
MRILFVHVITKRRLREFWMTHASAEPSMKAWFKAVAKAKWETLADLQSDLPSADYVAPYIVFNVGGNNYRVIAKVEFAFGKVFIAHVFTHAEYDRWKA